MAGIYGFRAKYAVLFFPNPRPIVSSSKAYHNIDYGPIIYPIDHLEYELPGVVLLYDCEVEGHGGYDHGEHPVEVVATPQDALED